MCEYIKTHANFFINKCICKSENYDMKYFLDVYTHNTAVLLMFNKTSHYTYL